jgi:hypothetical protein
MLIRPSALNWLSVELSDVHAAGAFPYIIPVLYVLTGIQEVADSLNIAQRFSSCGTSTIILIFSGHQGDCWR